MHTSPMDKTSVNGQEQMRGKVPGIQKKQV